MTPRTLVLFLAIGQFLAMADRSLFAVAAPAAARALHLGDGTLGFALGTAFALGYGLAVAPFGRWADAGARRALAVGGFVAWTLGSLATGLASGPATLIAARVVLGVGQAAFVPAALSVLTDAPAAARPWRLAAFTTASGLGRSGALLGGAVILALVTPAGWRWLFVLTALPNALLAILLAATMPPVTAATAGRAGFALTRRQIVYLFAAVSPLIVGQAASAWLPSLAVRRLGWPADRAGLLIGAITVMVAPAASVAGAWLGRHWPGVTRRPAAVIAVALWLACPAFALLAGAAGPVALGGAALAATLAVGIATFVGLLGWQELTPAAGRGTANGVFMAVTLLAGAGLGPLLTGLLSEAGGSLPVALGITAVAAASLASLAALAGRAA